MSDIDVSQYAKHEQTLEAAKQWHQLAVEQEDWVAWYASLGNPFGDTSTYSERARLYRGAAATLMLEAMTCEEWCQCDYQLRPTRRCPKHQQARGR